MVDYPLIRSALEELFGPYPAGISRKDIVSLQGIDMHSSEKILHYLKAHGLIDGLFSKALGSNTCVQAKITEKGIDFLQPDGGLSSLAAPVIRIAPENLEAIVAAALEQRTMPEEERSVVKKALAMVGKEGLTVIVQRLIEAGITHAPNVLSLVRMP